MPVALETFVKQLTDSGVIAPGKLENFLPPKATPKDAQELARQLVQSKHLTKFQAGEIYQGRAKSLILGSYTILDKIGAGGMGQVFKAQHRRMDRIVAIKMLPKHVMKDAATVARFEREVRAASKLLHPNIVSAFDADEAGGIHFLAMQYVEGNDLSALVKKDGALPVAKAVNYVLQAARGLEFAHGEGIVHRDIKPANLLLDKKGTVKVLDMGLARIDAGGDAATQAELTGTGAVMGTVDYMAPEQALSTKHADARADIYSLGCTLFYLLTGKPLYEGETLTARLIAHQAHPIPDLCRVRSDVPIELVTVFQKMVAKKIDDRYQTMSEVVADLEQCAASGSTIGASTTVADPPSSNSEPSLSTQNTRQSGLRQAATQVGSATIVSKPAQAGAGRNRQKLLLIGGGLLGAIILLAGVLIKLRTKDGTLVVEIDQPDAVVEVLNEEGKVEITRPGENGKVTLSVDPGKHRLKVEKDGFVVFGQDFEITSGENKPIKAHLVEDKQWFKQDFKKWEKDVAEMPAEEQVQAVRKRLMELNPDFDGRLEEEIVYGAVAAVSPFNDHLLDISPLRAFSKLKTLRLLPSGPQFITQFADLSPLAGMALTSLDCSGTKVSDLSSLAGMPLATLKFDWAPVSDLAPLKGMELTALSCFNTKVRFLSPLVGMPLKSLICYGTQISDLSPLQGMKLTELHCRSTQISDLSLLKGMPLTMLDVGGTQVSDLSPLAGMPLTYFGCNGTPVSDLSPLKETKLTSLDIGATKVSVLLPLMGLPLTMLACNGTQVSDLSPLEGMALTRLDLTGTNVSNLSPLAGMPLSELQCGDSKVADLSPLRGMPLGFLSIGNCSLVSELSPLEGMPLTFLHLGGTKVTPAGVAALRKTLPANCDVRWDEPAAVGKVWESPAFKKWEQDVAKLPAEEQVKAVAKKLQELNPGFDGKMTSQEWDKPPKIENGVVTEIGFDTDRITDISPVRALSGLKKLSCGGSSSRAGTLSDLSPLKGMQLTRLNCSWTAASDLSPLNGMPLTELHFGATQVSDLSPLRGMPLTNLGCGGNLRLSDISPLKGMPLTKLTIDNTSVSDLSALQGMPLTELWCERTPVSDLSSLRDMNLVVICLTPKNISIGMDALRHRKSLEAIGLGWELDHGNRLTPAEFWKKYDAGEFGKPDSAAATPSVKPVTSYKDPAFKKWEKQVATLPAEEQVKAVAQKLKELNPGFDGKLTGWKASATPAIEGGKVTEIGFLTDNVSDISPVRALRFLHALWVPFSGGGKTRLHDLSPLTGMHLRKMHVDGSSVRDLSPLKGMPLAYLSCGITAVADLSPLPGMPLEYLNCGTTQVADLSPLREMKLTTLYCDKTAVSDLRPLKDMELEVLMFHDTPVSDLSPLRGMPLRELVCNDTQVSDLSPLAGMHLESVAFTPERVTKGMDSIRRMQSVKAIGLNWDNRLSPADFWQKYDAGEFGKPGEAPSSLSFDFLTSHGKWQDAYEDARKRQADLEKNPIALAQAMPLWLQAGDLAGYRRQCEMFARTAKPELAKANMAERFEEITALNFGMCAQSTDEWSTPLKLAREAPRKAVENVRAVALAACGLVEYRARKYDDAVQTIALFDAVNTGYKPLPPLAKTILAMAEYRRGNATAAAAALEDARRLIDRDMPKVERGETFDNDNRHWSNWLRCQLLFAEAEQLLAGKPDKTGGTGLARPPAGSKKITTFATPEFKQWEKETAKLPAEEQVKEVVKKLQQFNPGFDGQETHKIEGDVVMELVVLGNDVNDLSPVRALAALKCLKCDGIAPGKGRLSDLSPLKGMQLLYFGCERTEVSDLSPLAQMPLVYLWCSFTKVSDLSPLKGKQLTMLWFSGTPVADLSPLRGMPLADLHCDHSRVTDLSPLAGMNLKIVVFTPSQVTQGIEAIRQIKSFEQIGIGFEDHHRYSPADFWQKYDAGEFNK